jgi:hypothetical protein
LRVIENGIQLTSVSQPLLRREDPASTHLGAQFIPRDFVVS